MDVRGLVIRARPEARPRHRLDPARLVETARNLSDDIDARLPGSSLAELARELVKIAGATSERSSSIQRPRVAVRVLSALAVGAGGLSIAWVTAQVHAKWSVQTVGDLLGVVSAGTNLAILSAGAVWSCLTLEARLRRREALGYIEELREFLHVIDVTQLYYTPDLYRSRLAASPPRPAIDESYLLYCTQMLAVIGNLAPLYTRGVTGDSILRAASDVEMLAIAITTKHLSKAKAVRWIGGGSPRQDPPTDR